jgi:hypothetical protein
MSSTAGDKRGGLAYLKEEDMEGEEKSNAELKREI